MSRNSRVRPHDRTENTINGLQEQAEYRAEKRAEVRGEGMGGSVHGHSVESVLGFLYTKRLELGIVGEHRKQNANRQI